MVAGIALLASHGPQVRWEDTGFLVGAALAVVAGVLMLLLAGRDSTWSVAARTVRAVGAMIATLPMNMLWATGPSVGATTFVGAMVLSAPLAVALHARLRRPASAHLRLWWVLVVAGSALMIWIVFGTGDWDNGNDWRPAYAAWVIGAAALIVGLWTFAWRIGWGAPMSMPSFRLPLTPDERGIVVDSSSPSRAPALPVTSTARARRIRWLSWAPLLVGAVFIPTVLLAPAGAFLVIAGVSMRRAVRRPLADGGRWPRWAVPVLVANAGVAAIGSAWLLIWAIDSEFRFSSPWSNVAIVVIVAWSLILCVTVAGVVGDVRRVRSPSGVTREVRR